MFAVTDGDIGRILHDYGIPSGSVTFTELQRDDHEEDGPASGQVRLIVRADPENGRPLVLRFKREEDAPQEIIEAQSRFAALLYANGIRTPKAYRSGGSYARRYLLNGYDVIVTAEDFEQGEIKQVDAETAERTGSLLAEMHTIAEKADCHVRSEVLFDPLKRNELFSFEEFAGYGDTLAAVDRGLFDDIVREHARLARDLAPFGKEPRFAVQGDLSDCNLYRTEDGEIGVFDFNRCGDSVLYLDAVMQAIFVARLRDYPDGLAGRQEGIILASFLRGYHRKRPFTEEQKAVFPSLYALVSAFWLGDLRWDEGSLAQAVENGDRGAVHEWMKEIRRRESCLPHMPL